MHGFRLPLLLSLSLASGLSLANTRLAELYELANDHSPELQIQRNDEQISEQNIRSAFGRLLPSVSASAGLNASGEDLSLDFENTAASASIRLSQIFYDQRAISGYQAVQANDQATRLQTRVAQQQLMLDVAEAALAVLRAQTNTELAERELNSIGRQLEQTREKYQVGLVARTDVENAQATFDGTQVRAIQASSQLLNAQRSLDTLVGQSVTVAPLQQTEFSELRQATEQDLMLSLQRNPSLLAGAQSVRSQELQLAASRAQRLPSITGSLSYSESYSNWFNDQDALRQGGTSASISLSLPLFDGFQTSADIEQNLLRTENARLRLQNQQTQLADQIALSLRMIETDRANIRAQQQLVTSRRSALEATTTGQEVGTQTVVEVLAAQSNFFAAERDLANARLDYVLNQLRLKQLTGELSLSDLAQLN